MKPVGTLEVLCLIATLAQTQTATERSKEPKNCAQFKIDQKASQPPEPKSPPSAACTTRPQSGKLLPDPKCTPGAINPSVTEAILRNPAFRTGCIRNEATTEEQKAAP